MSYIITNLTMWAIRSPKGFGFNPHLAEKRGTLLLQATFGHTVGQWKVVFKLFNELLYTLCYVHVSLFTRVLAYCSWFFVNLLQCCLGILFWTLTYTLKVSHRWLYLLVQRRWHRSNWEARRRRRENGNPVEVYQTLVMIWNFSNLSQMKMKCQQIE